MLSLTPYPVAVPKTSSVPVLQQPTAPTPADVYHSLAHKQRMSVLEKLAIVSASLSIGVASLLVFSPLLAKHAKTIVRRLRSISPLSESSGRKLEALLSDREAFQTKYKRVWLGLGVLSVFGGLENGKDSKQPSMFAAAIMNGILGILGMKFPNDYVWSASAIRAALYNSGKHNDLENYNHPAVRREWDMRRLNPFSKQRQTYGKELRDFSRFIASDFRYTLSVEPWRKLSKTYSQKETWSSPQPHLSSINAQFNLLTWVSTIAGLILKSQTIKKATVPIFFTADFIMNLLIYTRAVQNRKDLDGQLVLAGSPLAMLGLPFQPYIFPKLFFLNGFGGIGNALSSTGVMLNSKKHGDMVDALKAFQKDALQHPSQQASELVDYFSQPKVRKQIRHDMGSNRSAFFLQTLKDAELAQKSGIPLAQFLEPIAKSHEDMH